MLGDFTGTGSIMSTVPVMLFAVAFGLAMDYQVFMLSRIREEYQRRGDSTPAVAMGLERIGRIVTAAAVLISIVFLAFLVSDITLMKAFGVGLPLAVLLDAALIRGALLPAAMRLGGRATWWAPGPLRRLHARLGLREPLIGQPQPLPGRVALARRYSRWFSWSRPRRCRLRARAAQASRRWRSQPAAPSSSAVHRHSTPNPCQGDSSAPGSWPLDRICCPASPGR
jgi:MMPL family